MKKNSRTVQVVCSVAAKTSTCIKKNCRNYNEVIICDMCDMCDLHDICDESVICMICMIYVICVI